MKFRILLTFTIASIGVLRASPEPPEVELSICTYTWEGKIAEVFFRDADGEEVVIAVPNGGPSEFVRYKGKVPINFYQRIDGTDTVVAQFEPQDTRDQLLIFQRWDGEGPVAYRVRSLPFSKVESRGKDVYRFVNLTEYTVYVGFGDEVYVVEAGTDELAKVDDISRGSSNVTMRIKLDNGSSDKGMEYSSSWSIRSGRSALVFIDQVSSESDDLNVERLYY